MERFMALAIEQAKIAMQQGEVPIGAVIEKNNEVIAVGHNLKETLKDATAHAEIIAIRRASGKLRGWRLVDCNLYVTVEPCSMCCSAILQSRISKVYFGIHEPKTGAIKSKLDLPKKMGSRLEYQEGLMAEECKMLMDIFFAKLRK